MLLGNLSVESWRSNHDRRIMSKNQGVYTALKSAVILMLTKNLLSVVTVRDSTWPECPLLPLLALWQPKIFPCFFPVSRFPVKECTKSYWFPSSDVLYVVHSFSSDVYLPFSLLPPLQWSFIVATCYLKLSGRTTELVTRNGLFKAVLRYGW